MAHKIWIEHITNIWWAGMCAGWNKKLTIAEKVNIFKLLNQYFMLTWDQMTIVMWNEGAKNVKFSDSAHLHEAY